MHATRKLWTWLAVICVLSFAVLGWVGTEIYLTAPPIPKQVVSSQGDAVFDRDRFSAARRPGSPPAASSSGPVWGHGSYVAPDWSADWLHREALALRAVWAQRDFGKPFEQLSVGQQGEPTAGSRARCGATRTTRRPAPSRSRPSAPRRSSRSRALHRPVRQ